MGTASFPRGRFLAGFVALALLAATEAAAPGRCDSAGDSGADGGVEEPVQADTHRDDGGGLSVKAGRPVPANPEPWQKVPPCLPDTEESLSGACYVRAARRPPCPPSLYESGSACFVAVARARRPNTSMEE